MDLTLPPLPMPSDPAHRVQRLVGVLNMDDTVLGRTSFRWSGVRNRKRCALHELTHDGRKLTDAWQACAAQLPVPFEFVARDKRPKDLMIATGGMPPVVVAYTEAGGLLVLLRSSEIEACAGDPNRLLAAIQDAVPRWTLSWT